MKNIIKKLQEEIAYAKDRMLTYDEKGQNGLADVENGKVQAYSHALDIIEEARLEEMDAMAAGMAKKEADEAIREEADCPCGLTAAGGHQPDCSVMKELEFDKNESLKLE